MVSTRYINHLEGEIVELRAEIMKLKELLYGRSEEGTEKVEGSMKPFGGFRPRAEVAKDIKLKLSNQRRAANLATGGSGIKPTVVGDVPVVSEAK